MFSPLLCTDFVEAMTYDVHAHVATLDDPRVARLHADAEVFDPRTEVCDDFALLA